MAQISMETALDAARQRVGELAWEVTLLRAQLSEAEAENAKLRGQASPPAAGVDGSGAAPAE